jgi:hypothetical protein
LGTQIQDIAHINFTVDASGHLAKCSTVGPGVSSIGVNYEGSCVTTPGTTCAQSPNSKNIAQGVCVSGKTWQSGVLTPVTCPGGDQIYCCSLSPQPSAASWMLAGNTGGKCDPSAAVTGVSPLQCTKVSANIVKFVPDIPNLVNPLCDKLPVTGKLAYCGYGKVMTGFLASPAPGIDANIICCPVAP